MQTKSQAPVEQMGEPFAGAVQVVHAEPHWVTLESETHWPLHGW